MTALPWDHALPPWMVDAMWRGDRDLLEAQAGCECCCEEHTHPLCRARRWFGCRGQQEAIDAIDCAPEAWAASYLRTRGMSLAQFLGDAS